MVDLEVELIRDFFVPKENGVNRVTDNERFFVKREDEEDLSREHSVAKELD